MDIYSDLKNALSSNKGLKAHQGSVADMGKSARVKRLKALLSAGEITKEEYDARMAKLG